MTPNPHYRWTFVVIGLFLLLSSGAASGGTAADQLEFHKGGPVLSAATTMAPVKARAAIHAFNLDGAEVGTELGLHVSLKAHALGLKVLDELRFRRTGLVVSVLVIVALIVGLVLKIREIEKKPS